MYFCLMCAAPNTQGAMCTNCGRVHGVTTWLTPYLTEVWDFSLEMSDGDVSTAARAISSALAGAALLRRRAYHKA